MALTDDREALAALCRSASRTLWVCAEDGASRETCESASRLLDRAAQALRAKPSEQPDWSCPNPRGLVPPIWFEVKSGKAKPTAAQYWFARLAVTHGEGWIHGGVERAKERLRAVGCLHARGGVEVLVPLRGTKVA